jgi:predicted transcriptional regulator
MSPKTNKRYLSISLDTILGENISLSQAELDVLKALIRIGGSNTYEIWKESGLKHYPTVLRNLKKLQLKGLSRVTHLKTGRARNIYTSSFLGTLTPAMIEQDRERLLIQMSKQSTKFEDLLKLKIENDEKYHLGMRIIRELFRKRNTKDSEDIDKLVKDQTEDYIAECTLEITNQRHDEKELSEILGVLKELTTIQWIKKLVISFLDRWSGEIKEDLRNFQRFRKQLA